MIKKVMVTCYSGEGGDLLHVCGYIDIYVQRERERDIKMRELPGKSLQEK